MTVSRSELIKRAAIRLGGQAGSISSGTATTAVLSGLIDTTGDDSKYVGWHLFMPDAATEADREKVITAWDDSLGKATFLTRSDTDYTSENFILSPDYSLVEHRNTINLALRQSKRTYRYVLPLISGFDNYSLSALTWLEGGDDVDAVFVNRSPNMLHNEDFEFWQAGSASAPDGWTLAGSGATVAQASTGIRSPYAVTVTRASADATLYQDVPPSLVQHLVRSSNAALPTLSFGAWVTSSTANIARVGVYNGSTTAWSSLYSGSSGIPVFLESTYQTTATDTALRLALEVGTTAGSASFHAAVLSSNSTLPGQLKDRGSRSYEEYEPWAITRNVGGSPRVELMSGYGYGQLVIHSRRPFPEMTADTDVVEDRYADMLLAGSLRFLTDAMKPNQDRTRIDRIRGEEAAKWVRASEKPIDKPVPKPPMQVRIGGA